MSSSRKWQVLRKNWKMRLGRSLYHQDGSLRRPVFIGGVIVLTIPVVLFAIFTVLQFTGKDGDPPAEEKKPLVVSKQPITGEKKQNTAKASVKKGGAGAGSRNSDRPGVERRILGLTGRKLPEVGASFRADAQALTLARDPASVAAWERLLSWDSTNFSDSDRCWYAVALCESGSLAKGSALINWLVARLPKSADVQTAAGRCAFLRGDTEAAEACFKRAVALRSDRALPEKGTLQSLVLAEWAEAAGVPPGEAAAGEQGPEQEGEAETDPAEAQKVAQLRADAMRMTVSGDRTAREAWKRLFLSHPESAGVRPGMVCGGALRDRPAEGWWGLDQVAAFRCARRCRFAGFGGALCLPAGGTRGGTAAFEPGSRVGGGTPPRQEMVY